MHSRKTRGSDNRNHNLNSIKVLTKTEYLQIQQIMREPEEEEVERGYTGGDYLPTTNPGNFMCF